MTWLYISAATLLNLFLVLAGLYFGSTFFIPIAFGTFFALLLLPLAKILESLGFSRIIATTTSIIFLIFAILTIALLLSAQVVNLLKDIVQLQDRFSEQINNIKDIGQNNFINFAQVMEYFKTSLLGAIRTTISSITQVFFITTQTIAGFVVIITYAFLLLLYRKNLKDFIFSITSSDYHSNLKKIGAEITGIIPHYLLGVISIIAIEIILNMIGLYFIGVKQFLFWSMFVAFFYIIPFFGILIGSFIAVTYILAFQGIFVASLTALWFFCVQMFENNILVPLIMKSQIKLNPLAIIMVVFLGGLLWGVAGLVLFMPLLALVKVVLANIPRFKPYAEVMGSKSHE